MLTKKLRVTSWASNVACAVVEGDEASGDASVGGATTTGASAVAFGVDPAQTTAINPHPHTSDGHSSTHNP